MCPDERRKFGNPRISFWHLVRLMSNYAVRIASPYSKIERGVQSVALRADKVLAYEHVGTVTEKVHVHMIIMGARCDVKTLKADMVKGGVVVKGATATNGDWSWKTSFKDKITGDVIQIDETNVIKGITYMTKGVFDPKYNKGFSDEVIADAKSKWVEPPKGKASRQERLYYEFDVMVPKDIPTSCVYTEMVDGNIVNWPKGKYRGFEIVRNMAFKFAMEKCRGILGPGAKSMIQMLYQTYCFKHGIEMDPKFDRW